MFSAPYTASRQVPHCSRHLYCQVGRRMFSTRGR
ncbi:hypothetical protein A2U01_0104445, partial [Trifolium medium]|nr:hypothetical protein [Trifolium medium]